ncbi:prepilin peptidase-dependent protein [Pseudescherichia sp.]|uniref:prepilin peptidase-dependent protein n=1 Tax=Pseudescherichia sp. TaxID=2055881 RepID=UPI00289DB478|nr:prepilin peptidase-dependent protein [Pseudescherichia sp.]
MQLTEGGFSLLEVLIAMTIGSVLLLSAARFLPALQAAMLHQARQQTLEEAVWQHLFTLGKHLQRAGYCLGECTGQPLVIGRQGACVIVQWDANGNGRWEHAPLSEAEQTGFRLQNGVLETRQGAKSCEEKGWDKITDPATVSVQRFMVVRQLQGILAPTLTITLAAAPLDHPQETISATYSVVGYNL